MMPFAFSDKDQERVYLELMVAIQKNDGVECAQVPDIFFPDDWAVSKGTDIALAKQICERCPVRLQCLEYAMIAEDEQGLWAGLTAHERRQLRSLSKR
jgi:WhiB family redox-sensing transcriptional regulator